MKKWTQKLDKFAREVKESLNLDAEPKFKGQGRRLGVAPTDPGPHGVPGACKAEALNHGASTSRKAPASPYDALLTSINDESCIAALTTMLARVDEGKYQREETQGSMNVLRKVLCNIVADPDSDKVRTLRLSNVKIRRYVVEHPGAQPLLIACGFEIQNRGIEEDACLVISRDVAQERVSLMRRVVRVIENLLGIKTENVPSIQACDLDIVEARKVDDGASNPTSTTKTSRAGTGRRNTVLELPSVAQDADLPPEFYTQSLSEVRDLYKKKREALEQSRLLMTKAQRDKLQGRNQAVKPGKATVRVRVRAPEGAKIAGDFERHEPLQALFSWVEQCLDERIIEFDLVTPPPERKSIGDLRFDAGCTIGDMFGCDDVTLNLIIISGVSPQRCGSDDLGPSFKLCSN